MMTAPASVLSFCGTFDSAKVAYRADLYTLTLADGTVYRLTSADVSIQYGGNTWTSTAGLRRSNIRKTCRMEVDTLNLEIPALATLGGVTIGLLAQRGAFYAGRLQIDHLIGPDLPTALSYGPVLGYYEGRIAGTTLSGNLVRMAVESDIAALDRTTIPRFRFDLMCAHAVYDPNCALNKATFTDTGTASGTLTTRQVQTTAAAIIARAADYYNLGVLRFTSGALSGQRQSVSDFAVSGGVATFTMQLPFTAAPVAADAFSVYPGCDRTLNTCVDKFNNLVNFRGFPHIPGNDFVMRYPLAGEPGSDGGSLNL